jgi:hypothetical protein
MGTLTRRLTVIAALAAAACGEEDGGSDVPGAAPAPLGQASFRYEAAVATDPAVAAQAPECVAGVGRTHIHPSWRGFERIEMTPDPGGGAWTIAFDDVPVGGRERIRVSDGNVCAENPTGAATRGVFANGVRLTEVVDTPGSGTEPGLAFTLGEDGTVVP